jgi:hypothetical protein
MAIRAFAAISALCLVSACAIHPLPEDVTGVTTYQIVRRIRCETREAARTALIDWLANLGRDHPGQAGIPLARDLARKYEGDPNSISGFGPSLFKGPDFEQVRAVINLFYSVGIAYNFDLTMTEDNNLAGGSANFQKATPRSLFKLGIGAGMTRKRSNNRTFTVTDTFRGLLTELNAAEVRGRRYCDGQIVEANYVYPITGRIGVDRIVYDFLDLTVFANLAGPKSGPDNSGPPTMADKLTFTTTVDVSATPKIIFTPTGDAFQLTDAALTIDFKRSDMHQVTVGLAAPSSANVLLGGLRSYLFSPARGVAITQRPRSGERASDTSSIVVGSRVIGGGTRAETLAVLAIDQLKSLEIQLVPSP